MSNAMRAIETSGTIDDQGRLVVEELLPVPSSGRVRVIVLISEHEDEITELEWMKFLAHNSAFDFLADEAEDIYSIEDGRPFSG